MARRGISERSYYAFNPLPEITDADILKRAGLDDLMTPSTVAPFYIAWKYGGTLETEMVRLAPQGMFILRESECSQFSREWEEVGMVILTDPQDEDEVREKTLVGLQKAHTYWAARGNKRLVELRKTHGYSKDDMVDYKYEHWIYYANQAKADVIREEMQRIRQLATPAPAAPVIAQAPAPAKKKRAYRRKAKKS